MKPNTYVFIAGPYSAKGGGHDAAHWYEIDAHINEARLWATKLTNAGIPFYCPHMNTAHMEVLAPTQPPEFWYELDNLFLDRASAVLLIPGWIASKGAEAERLRAEYLDISIYRYAQFDQLVESWNRKNGETNNG